MQLDSFRKLSTGLKPTIEASKKRETQEKEECAVGFVRADAGRGTTESESDGTCEGNVLSCRRDVPGDVLKPRCGGAIWENAQMGEPG